MNLFGGDWTQRKIEIVVEYAKAYLTIMNSYPQFKCLYFDGFAGSGNIYKDDEIDFEIIKGAAIRILEIDVPKPFDVYYFVELDSKNKEELEKTIKENFPKRKSHVVTDDCNNRLIKMSSFLNQNKNYKTLAFIDPYGMALKWSSIEILKGLGIDLWVLVPTGIGMNRLLKRNGDIRDAWLTKLELSLGLTREEIRSYFYKSKTIQTLFGEETSINKEEKAIQKAADLYKKRLNKIFKFVSQPLELKNSTGSIMYHFMMASNNASAFKIANDIIKKYKN
ncbi:MAG TPA: three-Cys-motif partner protein TcmP [Chitinophagaceae bacterium]|nr:three-Cys-motif partner protein TcmP [Chitinophagaceae bacterium]